MKNPSLGNWCTLVTFAMRIFCSNPKTTRKLELQLPLPSHHPDPHFLNVGLCQHCGPYLRSQFRAPTVTYGVLLLPTSLIGKQPGDIRLVLGTSPCIVALLEGWMALSVFNSLVYKINLEICKAGSGTSWEARIAKQNDPTTKRIDPQTMCLVELEAILNVALGSRKVGLVLLRLHISGIFVPQAYGAARRDVPRTGMESLTGYTDGVTVWWSCTPFQCRCAFPLSCYRVCSPMGSCRTRTSVARGSLSIVRHFE